MNGPEITARYIAQADEPPVCPRCDTVTVELVDGFYCVSCKEGFSDLFDSRINVTYVTFGGERRWVTAGRSHALEPWEPLRARDVPPYPAITLSEGDGQ